MKEIILIDNEFQGEHLTPGTFQLRVQDLHVLRILLLPVLF